jgi:hypothetical protein
LDENLNAKLTGYYPDGDFLSFVLPDFPNVDYGKTQEVQAVTRPFSLEDAMQSV